MMAIEGTRVMQRYTHLGVYGLLIKGDHVLLIYGTLSNLA